MCRAAVLSLAPGAEGSAWAGAARIAPAGNGAQGRRTELCWLGQWSTKHPNTRAALQLGAAGPGLWAEQDVLPGKGKLC